MGKTGEGSWRTGVIFRKRGAAATEFQLTLTVEKWDPNVVRSFDFSEDLEIQGFFFVVVKNSPTVKCGPRTQ